MIGVPALALYWAIWHMCPGIWPRRLYHQGIDSGHLSPNPSPDTSSDDSSASGDEVSSSVFADRQGFFRARDSAARFDVTNFSIEAGPTWTASESNGAAKQFYARLAGQRDTVDHADAFDYVIANELLLLLSDDGQRAFEQHYRRMDDDLIRRWQDLLEGGKASDAFGPLSLQEQLDERQFADGLRQQRKSRAISIALLSVLVLGVLAGGVVLLRPTDSAPVTDTFSFEDPTAASSGGAIGSSRPTISGAVVAPIDLPVVVEQGDAPAVERVVAEPAQRLFDDQFDDLVFFLLAEEGEGRIAVLGGADWFAGRCIVASAVAFNLRPLSTTHVATTEGACGENPVGTSVEPTCTGPDVLIFPLDVPAGVVGLDEGGEATVDSIRLRVLAPVDGYEQVSLRGTLDLTVEGAAVIPAFGWSSNDTVELDVPVSAQRNQETTCQRLDG